MINKPAATISRVVAWTAFNLLLIWHVIAVIEIGQARGLYSALQWIFFPVVSQAYVGFSLYYGWPNPHLLALAAAAGLILISFAMKVLAKRTGQTAS